MRLAHGAVDDSFASAKGPRIGGGGGGVDSERRAAIGTPHGDSGSAKPHVCDASMSGDLPLQTRPVHRAVCHGRRRALLRESSGCARSQRARVLGGHVIFARVDRSGRASASAERPEPVADGASWTDGWMEEIDRWLAGWLGLATCMGKGCRLLAACCWRRRLCLLAACLRYSYPQPSPLSTPPRPSEHVQKNKMLGRRQPKAG